MVMPADSCGDFKSEPGADSLCERKTKDKHFLRLDNRTRHSTMQASEVVMNSLHIEGCENLQLGLKELALALSIQEWLVKKVLHVRRWETCQFEINDWPSLNHNSTGKGRLTLRR
jgi:hypothetical protein